MFLRGNIGFAGLSQFYEAIKRVDTIRWGPLSIEASLIDLFTLLELFAIGGYLVQFVVSGLLVRLQWEMRWYLVSDESLRLREGLWSLHEQTMTIANIQNLAVRRGPLQRLLGIGDLEVHTAGGGSGGQAESLKSAALHIGRFRDIDNPEALRDRIRRVLARHRDAGLGDPDDVHHGDEGPHVAVATAVAAGGPAKVGAGVGAEGIAQALGGLLAEARALRRAAEAAYG
jgi:membrane protein YdbS with pleckstrin-like domain